VALKVLHVAQPRDYGVPIVAAGLVRDQHERGWDVGVAAPDGSLLSDTATELGLPIHGWEASRAPGPSLPGEVARLRAIIGMVDPDLVHLHSAKAGLAGRLVLRGGRPTVFQPHAWSFAAVTGTLHTATVAWERFGARWADAIVCVSTDERESGRAAGVRGRWAVIPNGVDLTRFTIPAEGARATARKGLGLDPDAPVAVCPARLFEQKGQDVLLRAWPAVVKRVPEAQLVLVGEGPDRPQLEAMNAPRTTFAGETLTVEPWLLASDVVVLPSRWEAGLSLGAMEAMALGRSVVTTDVWGSRDGLGQGGGAIVPVDAVDPLTEALAERLGDRTAADAEGQVGRRRIEADYDVRIARERVAGLYEQVLQRR
jgi:glycosyltransferase involved in cell wall biosynthesis